MKLARTILLLAVFAFFVLAQSPFISFGPGTRTLGANRENMDKPFYRVGPFGWFAAAIFEAYGEYYYPSLMNYNPPGLFSLDPHNGVGADFNEDGREDLVITWAIFPHAVERQSRATFAILLNEGNGRLRYAPEMFEGGGPPLCHFAYRTAVADFNGDGRPDIVASSMGLRKRNPDGTTAMTNEPIPLVLSTPEGKLRDASADIEGQENGGLAAGATFGHDLSAGDVNGDGEPDFFTGRLLFLNDGAGKFLNATNQLPVEMKGNSIMTSSIGDLDGDGIGDIVAAYMDGAPGNRSGYILLSDGHSSLENRRLIELPPGRYGAGVTKFNYSVIMDVDQDGLNDIVFHVTRTNPYYLGRTIQVIMNKGNGLFVDETDLRVIAPANLDTAPGEATLHVVDVDRDGVKDLVLSAIGPWREKELHGMTVYLNSGGVLRAMEHSAFPWVQSWQIAGENDMRPNSSRDGMMRAYPLDLDGQAALDFISNVIPPIRRYPQTDPNEIYFYSILSVKPLLSSPMYSLTIQSSPNGTTDPAPGSHSYHLGSKLQVRAIPNRHYGFVDWSGSISGTQNPLTITLDSNKTMTPQFKPISPPLGASGRKIANRSLLQGEYVNVLSWQNNPANQGINNLKYRILQKTGSSWSLLAELDSGALEYRHRNVMKSTVYDYAIVATDGRGGQSVYVTIQ